MSYLKNFDSKFGKIFKLMRNDLNLELIEELIPVLFEAQKKNIQKKKKK